MAVEPLNLELTGTWPGGETRPRHTTPWEDPDLSRFSGFWGTLAEVLFRPGDFFQNLGAEGLAEAGAFALIVSTGGLALSYFWALLLLAGEEGAAGSMLALMVFSPFLALVNLGVGSVCLWGGAAMAGGNPGFTPVWRVYCYAQGGLALGVIPLFGGALAALWVLYLTYEGLRKGLGKSFEQALGALLVFGLLQVLLLFLLLGLAAALLALLGLLLLLG